MLKRLSSMVLTPHVAWNEFLHHHNVLHVRRGGVNRGGDVKRVREGHAQKGIEIGKIDVARVRGERVKLLGVKHDES